METIFDVIYHFISGCTYGIKTGLYYLAQVPPHLAQFVAGARRFIAVIPEPWGAILGFGLTSSIAVAFIRKKGA